ncbi:MAG: class I SAM-dependent methyltransferase [Planctomycetota bacterium]
MPDPSQYNVFAAEYGEFVREAPYNAHYDRPAMLKLIGDVEGARVLDAACGSGLYLAALRDRGAVVEGFDASAKMLELARDELDDGTPLRVHSMDDPLDWIPDASLDLVVSALAYHYANRRPAFLAEVHRVLRPGGHLVISTHHPTNDWVRLGGSYFEESSVTETWSRGWVVTARRTPLTTLTEEFAEAGFLIERLVEPRPQLEMEAIHPKGFAKLKNRPAFILFRLLKR